MMGAGELMNMIENGWLKINLAKPRTQIDTLLEVVPQTLRSSSLRGKKSRSLLVEVGVVLEPMISR
jgi:hypothetical protein